MGSEAAAVVATNVPAPAGATAAEPRTLASTLEADAAPPDAEAQAEAAKAAKAAKLVEEQELRKLAREERKEQIALRHAKQADRRRKFELQQESERVSAMKAEIEALKKQIEADPYEHAAKSRGKTRLQMMEEENHRLLNEEETKKNDETAELRAEMKKLREEREAEKVSQKEQFEKWQAERRVADFHAETRKTMEAEGKKTLPLVHAYPIAAIEREVLTRLDVEFRKSGERLDRKEVLRQIEKELRADLQAKRDALEAAEREGAPPPSDPDRSNGAVTSPQRPEATANPAKGPATLTQRFASQSSGRTRVLAEKERNAEADKFLLGR